MYYAVLLFGRKKEKPLELGAHRPNEKSIEKDEKVELKDIFLIPNSEIPDDQKQEFLNALTHTSQAIGDETASYAVLYEEDNTGIIKYFDANVFLPIKAKGENVLWYRIKHEGVFHKKIRAFEALTNYRAYFYDLAERGFRSCPIFHSTDVVVNNQKRISESQRQGSFAGVGARGTFVGSTGGTSTGESQTFGDVNLLNESQIDFVFFSIADPNGLASLIKTVINNWRDIYKKLEKQDKTKSQNQSNKNFNCEKCGTSNPSNSKFCNKCGSKLGSACIKCGANNPDNSSFCNKCGFTLK